MPAAAPTEAAAGLAVAPVVAVGAPAVAAAAPAVAAAAPAVAVAAPAAAALAAAAPAVPTAVAAAPAVAAAVPTVAVAALTGAAAAPTVGQQASDTRKRDRNTEGGATGSLGDSGDATRLRFDLVLTQLQLEGQPPQCVGVAKGSPGKPVMVVEMKRIDVLMADGNPLDLLDLYKNRRHRLHGRVKRIVSQVRNGCLLRIFANCLTDGPCKDNALPVRVHDLQG